MRYVTVTLMTFDRQSHGRRTAVETKSVAADEWKIDLRPQPTVEIDPTGKSTPKGRKASRKTLQGEGRNVTKHGMKA